MDAGTNPVTMSLNRWWATVDGGTVPVCWRGTALAERPDVADIATAARRGDDDTLIALLRLVHGGDNQAGLTLVWALWPRLRRAAIRRRIPAVAGVATSLWLVMMSYSIDRRPRHIAANLILDALKDARVEVHEYPMEAGAVAQLKERAHGQEGLSLTADAVITRAVRTGVISSQAGRVLRSVYVEAMSGRAAAIRHATTETAIRWRCSSSLRRMAARAAQLAA